MRSLRALSVLLAISLVLSVVVTDGPPAFAQSVDDARQEAEEAKRRADVASGLVDEAVAEREELERELAETISRVSELGAELSVLGTGLDRIAEQLGFADVEVANIESAIEVQAVDAYMTVLASPSVTVVNTRSVEHAMVASSVVEDVVRSGRATVDELVIKLRDLRALQEAYLAEQTRYLELQAELDAEVEHLAELYEQADAQVAEAVRRANAADAGYREALTAVELAQAREEERRRQEQRDSSDDSTSPGTTPTTSPGSDPTSPPTTDGSDGGGGQWDHPPAVEQWRPLVEQYFPPHRVEQALRILDCESNGQPDAYNPYSGASGLFQFIPSTWASTAPKAGYPDASPFEPVPNTASAAWLANRYEQLGLYYWAAWSCKRVLD